MFSFNKVAQSLPGVSYIYSNVSEHEINLSNGKTVTTEVDGFIFLGTTSRIPQLDHKILLPSAEEIAEAAELAAETAAAEAAVVEVKAAAVESAAV